MIEKFSDNEVVQFFLKILFPAFLGVGVKIAIEMRKDRTKISLINVCLSLFIGVSGAYLFSGLIQESFEVKFHSIVIAFVAIISDKVAEYIIYKWNIDTFLTAFFNGLFDWISNVFKRN